MLLIDYFKTCWLLNILCKWWRHVGDQKDSAPCRLLHCLPTLSCVCRSVGNGVHFIDRRWCENAVSTYTAKFSSCKTSAHNHSSCITSSFNKIPSASTCMLAAQGRPSISLIYSSASNLQTSSRRCGPFQIVRPQPSRSQDMAVLQQRVKWSEWADS